ncbi:MAG: class I tRNA ligase family protein [Alistipes putredinis]
MYSRTSSATHAATASEFSANSTTREIHREDLHAVLRRGGADVPSDRYIVGTCPKCGNDRAYGDQCEMRVYPLARRADRPA